MPESFPVKQYSLVLPLVALACALLFLSWPRLQASVRYLPVDTAISRYFDSREIPAAQLEGLVARARESLDLHDHYRYWDGLSLLLYLRGLDDRTPAWKRRMALQQSIRAGVEVVQRAPAKPRVWLRIAQIRAYLGQPQEQVIAALKMSILTGRVEPTLLLARLELGYRYLPLLDAETVSLLRDQTVLTWKVQPRELLSLINAGKVDFVRVKTLLAGGNEDIIAEMEGGLEPDFR